MRMTKGGRLKVLKAKEVIKDAQAARKKGEENHLRLR